LDRCSLKDHQEREQLKRAAEDEAFRLEGQQDDEHMERWRMNSEDHRERHLNPPGDPESEAEEGPQCKKHKS
jgi:hypothetical protein